jgi:hypothetical protein
MFKSISITGEAIISIMEGVLPYEYIMLFEPSKTSVAVIIQAKVEVTL